MVDCGGRQGKRPQGKQQLTFKHSAIKSDIDHHSYILLAVTSHMAKYLQKKLGNIEKHMHIRVHYTDQVYNET